MGDAAIAQTIKPASSNSSGSSAGLSAAPPRFSTATIKMRAAATPAIKAGNARNFSKTVSRLESASAAPFRMKSPVT